MKVLVLSTSSNNTDTVIGSLDYLGTHEIEVFRYDAKYLMQVGMALAGDPSIRDQLQAGQFHLSPERVGRDAEMLDVARRFKPDAIVYISAWEGDFVPKIETLGELNTIAPLIHMCFDGADPPWWPQMEFFEEKGLFSLTVTIDGAQDWPGGGYWPVVTFRVENGGVSKTPARQPHIKNALTLLTPLDPRYFQGVQMDFMERPYPFVYAGNAGGWTRSHLVHRMQQEVKGFVYRQRDDHPQSYRNFCDFLRHSKAVISVPFTGSSAAKHVKGRVLEAGMAGAALLEWKNEATAAWFTPREMYLEYESVEEGIDMAGFMIGHPKLCRDMAAALHHRVVTEHSPEVFWKKVFAGVGK